MLDYILWALLILLGVFVLCVVFSYVCGMFVKNIEYKKNSKFYRFLLHSWTKFGIVILRIKLHVTGLDKVPTNSRFLLVSNHISNYDPIVTWHILKKYDLAFVSKESNFKIPFFGKFIRKCCFLEIDRTNPRNAIKTINAASELIKSNEVSIGIYPEGTRSKTEELLPFHNGVFKIAQKANVPIVVMKVTGTNKIYKNIPFKKSDVYVDILEVIDTDKVNNLSTGEIGEIVKKLLLKEEGEQNG